MKKFKKIYIEITNACNLNCTFCPPTKRERAYMTVEDFTHILDKIKPHGDYLFLHVKGEPLLHPELKSFLAVCSDKGFKVNITTNGTRLMALKEVLLIQPAIRQMNLSLQSFDHQVKENQRHYMQQLLDFVLEAHEKTEMFIELRLWNLEDKGATDQSKKRNKDILLMIEKALKLPFELSEEICKGKGIKIAERIYLSQSYEFEWPDLEREVISTTGFCYGLRNQIGVLVDGTVIPCCLDSEGVINLGNIHEVASLSTLIEAPRVQAMISGFSNREVVEPLCQRCGYRTRFEK